MNVTRVVVLASLVAGLSSAARAGEPSAGGSSGHAVMNGSDVKWGPAPESLPPGAQAAVVQGDPGAAGTLFTIRLKTPKGYAIPPHTHPTDEYVTVLSGKLLMGEGDQLDEKAAKALTAGGWAAIPSGHHHYVISDAADTIVQVHAMGPFQITYVNPKDDPRSDVANRGEPQRSRAGRTPPATTR